MQETIEFRIPERRARERLPRDLGTRLGDSVRKVVIPVSDPWVGRIGRIEKECRAKGRCFFTSSVIQRKYTPTELSNAPLLTAEMRRYFEPAGEECGTEYDESSACPNCGAGATQTTPLFLNGRRLPKRLDLAQSIAGEVVVSRRVVQVAEKEGLSGIDFEPIRLANKRGAQSTDWYQPSIRSARAQIHAKTHAGEDIFDTQQYGRCPRGDLIGLNRLSEVWVDGSTYDGADFALTKEYFGVRRGLLRPEQELLVSPKAARVFAEARILGYDVEIAHIV